MSTASSVNPTILAKAAILRQLGAKPGDGLPSWARQTARLIAGPDAPAASGTEIGNTSVSGGGVGLLDLGIYPDGFGQYAGYNAGSGDSQHWQAADYDGFNRMLQETGQRFYEASNGSQIVRWGQDATGKVNRVPLFVNANDSAFWTAAQLASGVLGGAVGGQAGGALASAANAAGNTAVETGNFSQALKQALISLGTSYVGNAASAASGLTGAAGNAVGGAVGSGASTAARGGNLAEVLKSALVGAAPGAAGALGNNNQALSPVLSTLVRQLASTAVGRKPSTQAGSIQLLMAALKGGGK